MLRWLWEVVTQWSEQLQVKQGPLGSIPVAALGFSTSSWLILITVDGIKAINLELSYIVTIMSPPTFHNNWMILYRGYVSNNMS